MKSGEDPVLLTLAIPTFNRLSCLQLLLNSLICQINSLPNLSERLEILVCDNASIDGTDAYLKEIESTPFVRVITQCENRGGDNNIIDCFENSLGEYVWIIGDDDLPMKGCIASILDLLSSNNIDLLYMPSRFEFGDLTTFCDEAIDSPQIRIVGGRRLALEALEYVTFISSWVINKRRYYSLSDGDPGKYRGTNLCQLEWIFALISSGTSFAFAKQPWIVARGAASGGYSLFEVFASRYVSLVDDKFPDDRFVGRLFQESMLLRFFPGLIWSARFASAGNFSSFNSSAVLKLLKDAYGGGVYLKVIIEPICIGGKRRANIMRLIAGVYARLWLCLRKL